MVVSAELPLIKGVLTPAGLSSLLEQKLLCGQEQVMHPPMGNTLCASGFSLAYTQQRLVGALQPLGCARFSGKSHGKAAFP